MKAFYEYELNGKKVSFHRSSEIEVQIGKNSSAYKTKWRFPAEQFGRAVLYYSGLNIGNGYKKRLVCQSLNKPVLARQFS